MEFEQHLLLQSLRLSAMDSHHEDNPTASETAKRNLARVHCLFNFIVGESLRMYTRICYF